MISVPRSFLSLFTLTLFAVIGSGPATAQIFDNEQVATISFGTENPQLRDTLQLQYQMQMLRQLIDHEKAVNAMVKSAVELGLRDPAIPSPNRSLCTSVPANIPCAQSYKTMYEGYKAERPKMLQPINVAPPAPSLMEGTQIPSMDAAALPDLPAEQMGFDSGKTLYWTDITCMGSRCSAVITPEPANARSRYRVVAGETLPDGSVIKAISALGVTIERNKKDVLLDPAPQA